MDPEIAELKELVKRNIALTQETNRLVHKIRRSSNWGLFFNLLYWIFIGAALVASYVYVSPYISNLEHLYRQVTSASQTFQKYLPQQPQ